MGRTLKRVPLNFAWPIGKTWGGYLNPYYGQATPCDKCNGNGHSAEYNRLLDQWYGNAPFRPEDRGSKPFTIHTPEVRAFADRNCSGSPGFYGTGTQGVRSEAERLCKLWNAQWCHHLNADDVKALLDHNRLWDFTRTPRTEKQREIVRRKVESGENSWLPEDNGYIPTPEEVNAWSLSGFGHDSINAWIVIKAECARLGYPTDCPKCEDGSLWPSPEIAKLCEEWKESEPPTGEGFQLWETTSEGSPSSPVFATMEELCEWCAANATTFGSSTATAEQWREMLDQDFVHATEGNNIFL